MPRPGRWTAMAALVAALCGGEALLAQPRLRLEPELTVFSSSTMPPERTRFRTVGIWIDDVPAPGLGSFLIKMTARVRRLPFPLSPCAIIDGSSIDPGLVAMWNGSARSNFSTTEQITTFIWQAFADRQGTVPLPTGSIRVGGVTYRATGGDLPTTPCIPPLQDEFSIESTVTKWGHGPVSGLEFSEIKGGAWAFDALPDIDLTAPCTRVSPAGNTPFVDGDILRLDCMVSNLGSFRTTDPPTLRIYASQDTIVDVNDAILGDDSGTGFLDGHATITRTILRQPVLTTAQTTNICSKIDVDVVGEDQGWGVMYETDESNNVSCSPMTIIQSRRDMIVAPGSLSISPDPGDPAGLFRAGLDLRVDYAVLNQGIGAVRGTHLNAVGIGTTQAAAFADPNGICGAIINTTNGLPLIGGATLPQGFGLGSGTGTKHCKIPFVQTPGNYNLYLKLDSTNKVVEEDPGGASAPAEGNNVAMIPILVSIPLDPQFRIQHRANDASDQRVEIFGPAQGKFFVSVASASGLTSYAFDVTWSPANLFSITAPSQIIFQNFMETGGLVQSCSLSALDNAAGRFHVACTTADPSGTGKAASTEESQPLVEINVDPLLPGEGTLTVSGFSAADAAGQPFVAPRSSGGSFVVTGSPELHVESPVAAPAAWPGVDFSVSFDVRNNGFGTAKLPIQTDLYVSLDADNDIFNPSLEDLLACTGSEGAPLPGKVQVNRSVTDCRVRRNLRPGIYTGFFQIRDIFDESRRATAPITFPARLLALRKSGSGRSLEIRPHPVMVGDTTGPEQVGFRSFPGTSLTTIKAESRNFSWAVELDRPKGHLPKLTVSEMPIIRNQKPEILRELRVTGTTKAALSGADVDGDGDDELILLVRSKRLGDMIDVRRIDYFQFFPGVCATMALSDPLPQRIVALAGLQFDGDVEDELAILTKDGRLTIYDVELTGPIPPAEPCILTGEPAFPQPHGLALLTPVASSEEFSPRGERVRSICALDFDLDGVDEIGGLHDTGRKSQAFRIYAPPATLDDVPILLADDEEFGGAAGRGRILDIACTR